MPVRVLADGWELTGTGRFSGLGSYSRNMFGALARRDDVDLRVLTCDPEKVPAGATPVRMHRRFFERRRALYEHEGLISVTMALHRSDVIFSPVLQGVPRATRPYVQTLHDLIPVVLPDEDMAALRKWWKRWARTYRRAEGIVAISRYSADEAIRLLELDPARVHVAYNGVDPAYHPGPPSEGPDGPYLLAVSEYSRRKAFPHAFAMIGALADAGYPHHLEVAGRVQRQFTDEVAQITRDAAHPERVHVRGFVDDLAGLYRGAAVFVCTSRYEGFGLPVVEAMASGTPVVCYDNSSLPEICGDAAVLVPDGDVEALTAAVRSVLDSPARAAELREAGIERAKSFTWDAAAEVCAHVFAEVDR